MLKKLDLYLSRAVIDEVTRELTEETATLRTVGHALAAGLAAAPPDTLADWLGDLDGAVLHMRTILNVLEAQLDMLWERVPDDEDGSPDDQPAAARYRSLSDAAADYGLSSTTLRNQVANGRLVAVKIGRNWCTTAEWMEEYLASRQKPGRGRREFAAAPALMVAETSPAYRTSP